MSDKPVRVRIAPSPTGPMHIGLARTALYNWLFARSARGTFVLRIDDTDRARSTDESLRNILDGLRWLGLDWDEGPEKDGAYGPYFQMQRLPGYRSRVDRLVEGGAGYPCFCTPEEVQAGRERMQREQGKPMYDRRCRAIPAAEAAARVAAGERHTVRFAIPEGRIVVQDLIKGEVTVDLAELDDWVMLREDGTPLYNLCSTLDDADMAITHVIRGEEHFLNGIKQRLLFEALGLEPPAFAHIPLILGKDGKKLSKRMAQTNLLDYRDLGFPAAAIVNFVTLLGWGFDAEREVFSPREAVERFDLARVQKSGSIFDEEKLAWMCGVYIRGEDRHEFLRHCEPWLVAAGLGDAATLDRHRDWFANVAACDQERVRTYAELPPKLVHYVQGYEGWDDKAWKNLCKRDDTAALLRAYAASLADQALPPSLPDRPAEADTSVLLPTVKVEGQPVPAPAPYAHPLALEAAARGFAEERGVGFGQLVHPIRAALTGVAAGPSLFDILYLLGREEAGRRLLRAAEALEARAT
ncbi:MAG: glutamate--tRNA ligase [Planctomycetota bacterium]